MEKLVIGTVVGYMLKVKKSGHRITKYKDEFNAIRHGDYYDFVNRVNGPRVEFIAVWDHGDISTDTSINHKDCDMVKLYKSGPSLLQFFVGCHSIYGSFVDNDINDETYEDAALFEISLRMHANNMKLIEGRQDLIDIIKLLSNHHKMPKEDIEKLDQGREFLNMIKHFKNQFPTWNDGVNAFKEAFEIQKKYKFTII